jgi:3-methyladenine DNA glycosylase/8-oxoguanine DNA glycosylase
MPRRTIPLERPFDVFGTLGPLRRGTGDPTVRLAAGAFERASMTPDGPATISLRVTRGEIRAEAWGDGGERVLDSLPAFLGLDDDDHGFEPGHHPVVADLARRRGTVRLGRTGAVLDVLVPAILEQRITGTEAWRGYRRLVLAHGEPAPGPTRLRIAPRAEVLAGLPSWSWPQLGIEPRRGALLGRVARDAERLERLAEPARGAGHGGAGAAALAERLRAYAGIGPWTAAEVTLRALGDPDAVSVGDAHLSHVVAWSLAGEPRATDERMLELLEPWRGHRARVIRLLESSGRMPPRFGPRIAPRDLTELSPRSSRRFPVSGYRGGDGR